MSANLQGESPVGVWSGLAKYDGRIDQITVSFADDGTVALRTQVSAGRGNWVRSGPQRFTYHLKEELGPETAMTGSLDIDVEAEMDGAEYRGVSTAKISDRTGAVVRTIVAEVSASRQSTTPADWHANQTA
jgi:hypothetical protein